MGSEIIEIAWRVKVRTGGYKLKELVFEIAMKFPLSWMLRLLSLLISPLRKRLIGHISSQVRVERTEAYLQTAYTPAPISFRIVLDSKAPIRMTTEHVVLTISSGGTPYHTFRWSREDRCSEALGTVDDLPEKGHANIVFRYTPPIYMYSPTKRICLAGYVKFRCPTGEIYELLDEHVDLVDADKNRAITNIKQYYKDFFGGLASTG